MGTICPPPVGIRLTDLLNIEGGQYLIIGGDNLPSPGWNKVN